MRGPPDVQVMFTRSEGGERSRRRKGIARKMLRGESCTGDDGDCGCGRGCCDCDRAPLDVVGSAAVAGRRMSDGARGESCVFRRRAAAAGARGVVVVVRAWRAWAWASSALGVAGGEGETGMPKGVSSIFTLDEDATFLVAGWCIRGDCAAARALSLRWWWCVER